MIQPVYPESVLSRILESFTYRCVLQHYIVGAHLTMQLAFFCDADQDATSRVHDALWHASSATGVDNEEGIAKSHSFDSQFLVALGGFYKILKCYRTRYPFQTCRFRWKTRLS